MQETQEIQVQCRGWEDPLEEEMATHSNIPTWKIPWDRGAWWATVHVVAKSQTGLSSYQQFLGKKKTTLKISQF